MGLRAEQISDIYNDVNEALAGLPLTTTESLIANEFIQQPGRILPTSYIENIQDSNGNARPQSNQALLRNIRSKLSASDLASEIQKIPLFKRGMVGYVYFPEGSDKTITSEMIESAHATMDEMDTYRKRQYQKPKQLEVPYDERWFNDALCREVGDLETYLIAGSVSERQGQLGKFVLCALCTVMDYCFDAALAEERLHPDPDRQHSRGGVTPVQLRKLAEMSGDRSDRAFAEQVEDYRQDNFTSALKLYRDRGV